MLVTLGSYGFNFPFKKKSGSEITSSCLYVICTQRKPRKKEFGNSVIYKG